MGATLAQFFASLTMFFQVFNKGMTTLDNIVTIGEEKSAELLDETRSKRKEKALQLAKELRETTAATAA